jgi:hypothetical protein
MNLVVEGFGLERELYADKHSGQADVASKFHYHTQMSIKFI